MSLRCTDKKKKKKKEKRCGFNYTWIYSFQSEIMIPMKITEIQKARIGISIPISCIGAEKASLFYPPFLPTFILLY
jgi:hypothetical protein